MGGLPVGLQWEASRYRSNVCYPEHSMIPDRMKGERKIRRTKETKKGRKKESKKAGRRDRL